MVEILTVSHTDLVALNEITALCIAGMTEVPESDKNRLLISINENLYKNIEKANTVFLKACEHSGISGYILVQDYHKLSELFIHPHQHKRGIGTALLRQALATSSALGDSSYVWVNAALHAVPFYRKHGFVNYEISDPQFSFVKQLQYRFTNVSE